MSRLAWLQKNSPEPPTSAISPLISTVFSSACRPSAICLAKLRLSSGKKAFSYAAETFGSPRSMRVLKRKVSTIPLTEGCSGTSVFADLASAIAWSASVSPKPFGPRGPDPGLVLMSPAAPCMKTHLVDSSASTLFLRKPG